MKFRKMIAVVVVAAILGGCTDSAAVVSTPTATAIATPVVTATPVPTPSPTPVPTAPPEPTPDPYFTADEQVTVDAEAGYWAYSSPTLWVEINRIYDEELEVTYFVAEVRCKPGELARGGLSKPGSTTGKNVDLYKIMRDYSAVVAINGDFLADNLDNDPKGVIIRDGLVSVDNDDNSSLVFMPDGTMRVFAAGEATADELLAQGVTNSFSFGPVLINDGTIQDGLDTHYLRKKNPRAAVGMIEANHFLLVMVQGRPPEPTHGMTLTELAELFESYGCKVAYNMDGGASATIGFMGENISEYEGSLTGQRPVADALMFGTSELVPEP